MLCVCLGEATPQRNRGGNRGGGGGGRQQQQQQTPQQRAAQKPGGISTAKDGSVVLDQTVQINGLPIRYKVSAPADQFSTTSGIQGGAAPPATAGAIGMNVLLHGDGGQSFFDFPNQGVNANLMGVAVLAPDKNLKWGGADRNGQQRPDGVAHSQAVADLIAQELPKVVAFNQSNVFFTGVSGGSLTLSGFFMPAHMGTFPNTGVMLNCGGMAPQVNFTPVAAAAMANTRIHFQSTTQELKSLQRSIPLAVQAYEEAAAKVGLNTQQINALQTVENSPNGGHCAFDGQGFVSGVQLMADSYADVMLAGGSGQVSGIARVSGTETWQMLEGILGRPDITPLGIDKIVAFGLGNLTAEAVPGEECQTSCMQHAFLLRLGNLLRETMGHSVRCVAQDPAYLDTCKEALRARGVEIAEPESGFLLVDERTLVFTVSCNVPVRQIVTELAHPAGMIWGYVEPDEVLREWTRNEEGIWVLVREMVKGYNEYPLPEEDAACLWGSALYIRKETTETT
ncbi:cyclin-like F-box [Purpureocillium lavendulum]|uniref:Cyclin-like F-box n=1 Tax=Purpureocillium lavendulum TaxID=1247861 RepID=A0AB34FJJ1_9HYPO|nr:cyclin-like F-box [Purpureocillium lavendulum]